jgi:hypothetical protein
MKSLGGGIRRGALAGVALACAALVAMLPTASGRARQGCNLVPDSSTHWEAVFGHTTSLTQAILMRKGLIVKGYRNVQFEKDYCDDVELYVPGLDFQLRKTFASEGEKNGVQVTFEPPDNLKGNGPGEVTAVFGHRPTLKRANALQQAAATKGFRENSDVVRLALHDWKVVVTHVPADGKSDFAAEAKSGGFPVSFEP